MPCYITNKPDILDRNCSPFRKTMTVKKWNRQALDTLHPELELYFNWFRLINYILFNILQWYRFSISKNDTWPCNILALVLKNHHLIASVYCIELPSFHNQLLQNPNFLHPGKLWTLGEPGEGCSSWLMTPRMVRLSGHSPKALQFAALLKHKEDLVPWAPLCCLAAAALVTIFPDIFELECSYFSVSPKTASTVILH